jgi:SAM-dependent methyltransferase
MLIKLVQTGQIEDAFTCQDLIQMSKAKNYVQWQFSLIKDFLGKRIVEIGGGIGTFTTLLAKTGASVICLEPDTNCYHTLIRMTEKFETVQVFNIKAEQLNDHVPNSYKADTVVCVNVLEHIEDDKSAIENFAGLLEPGGRFIVFAPAIPWIYGKIDMRLGHFRRYTKDGLLKLLKDSHMEVERVRYFNFPGLLGWIWNTKILPKDQQSDRQIRFFDRMIVPWLSVIERFLPPPVGMSLIAIARKNCTGSAANGQ